MYKLAIIPKIHWVSQYSRAYGSQHDHKNIKKCLKNSIYKRKINFNIMSYKRFLKNANNFDGVVFIGISKQSESYFIGDSGLDMFTWSFNQMEWINRPHLFNNVKIVFEQSTKDLSAFIPSNRSVYYLPLGFQSNKRNRKTTKPLYDVVFNGTLDRSRRATAKFHRRDILKKLLEAGFSILNYNGRARKKVESKLLKSLKKFKDFRVVPRFGEPSHYSHGKYALNLPFHELGSEESIKANWGMSRHELENGNWLINWDLFRCIGARSNMITFDCPETRALGLNEDNCHFYQGDTTHIEGMAKEIVKIVRTGAVKFITDDVWQKNTYQARWDFIIDKICNNVGL